MRWSFIDFRFLVENETNGTGVNGDAPKAAVSPRYDINSIQPAYIRKPQSYLQNHDTQNFPLSNSDLANQIRQESQD